MSNGSIDIDEFENTDADELNGRTDTERIVRFLDEHDDRDRRDSAILLSALSTAQAATDRFGSEDPDEWGSGVNSDAESNQ